MKIIYVAGRLTAKNNFEITRNVRAAEDVGLLVVQLGAMPLIPHANTGLTFFGVGEEAFWYEGTLELLRRCDAMILVPGWEGSRGVASEIEEAKNLMIPIFERVDELRIWLATEKETTT